mmetsp:Transcript_3123/g.3529  ORF Transcript_3123/g.3529 Transcript_3123/m.3529 type:complete len:134 (+) Transcript_3123:93-494(+)
MAEFYCDSCYGSYDNFDNLEDALAHVQDKHGWMDIRHEDFNLCKDEGFGRNWTCHSCSTQKKNSKELESVRMFNSSEALYEHLLKFHGGAGIKAIDDKLQEGMRGRPRLLSSERRLHISRVVNMEVLETKRNN